MSVNRRQWEHFCNGGPMPPANGEYLQEFDPSTGAPSFQIACGSAQDVSIAVSAAGEALREWRDLKPIDRGRVLHRMAEVARHHNRELAEIDRAETGRPLPQILSEVETTAQYFEFYGGLVNIGHGEIINLGKDYHAYTQREPFGVVGIIVPWNSPLTQAGRGIAPALATGNTVVIKPSEFTSAALLRLIELTSSEAGLPRGVVNVVTGTGPEAGAALVAHPKVRKVAFTGSVRAGIEIGKVAAERLIPVGLELGGKSPNIVFEDAQMERAVAGVIKGFTANAGQICSAGTRCLVAASVLPQFQQQLQQALQQLPIGSHDQAAMGPMLTHDQFKRVQAALERAREQGANMIQGGMLPNHDGAETGWFIRPTILTNVSNQTPVVREEIFGPVLALLPFESEEEAIALANDTEYGLVAGIWTESLTRAHRVARQLEAGQVFINEYFAGGVETPFGGYKQSGYGREKGVEAMSHYTQVKCTTVRLG